jgi:hypothetical protein
VHETSWIEGCPQCMWLQRQKQEENDIVGVSLARKYWYTNEKLSFIEHVGPTVRRQDRPWWCDNGVSCRVPEVGGTTARASGCCFWGGARPDRMPAANAAFDGRGLPKLSHFIPPDPYFPLVAPGIVCTLEE